MSAQNGNRYAEKWTYESTRKALEKISFFAMQEDTLYLGMALARAGYYDDIWRYWRRKWARNFEIIDEMQQLMQHFEARIYTNTAKGKIPLRLGIFTLQHHYGWGKEVAGTDDLQYLAEADRTTAGPIQTFPQGEGFNSQFAQNVSEGEGLNTKQPAPSKPSPEGEGFNSDLTQPSPKERALMQTAVPIQTFPQGEGFNSQFTQTLTGEGSTQRADDVTELMQSNVAAKDARDKSSKRYPIELTPEELLLETGISDIREIEHRMREEDPELAEYDDMDEDME